MLTPLCHGLLPLLTAAIHPADKPLADWTLEVHQGGVRATTLVNFKFIDAVLGTEGDPRIPPADAQLAAIRTLLQEALGARNRVWIDGRDVAPRWVSFQSSPPPKVLTDREPDFARILTQVRCVAEYPVEATPEQLSFHWDFYPEHPLYDLPDSPTGPLEVDAVIVRDGKTAVVPFRKSARDWLVSGAGGAPTAAAPRPVRGGATPNSTHSLVFVGSIALAALATLILFVGLATRTTRRRGAIAAVLATLGLSACSDSSTMTTTTQNWVVQVSPQPAVRVNEHFSLVVRVRNQAGTEPTKVRVDADMPEHKHGMNTAPRITQQEDGSWLVEGMLFHMPGAWELYVYVGEGTALECATFGFEL